MAGRERVDLSKIKMLLMDVDGVLTDGTIILSDDGNESKKFSVVDGHGIKMWHRAGFISGVISGRQSQATANRAEQLGIGFVKQGRKEKISAFEELLSETKLCADEVAYIGDDLMDLPLVRRSGFGVAVANAIDELKQEADYITNHSGGNGAVREVIEYILKQTSKWAELTERYQV